MIRSRSTVSVSSTRTEGSETEQNLSVHNVVLVQEPVEVAQQLDSLADSMQDWSITNLRCARRRNNILSDRKLVNAAKREVLQAMRRSSTSGEMDLESEDLNELDDDDETSQEMEPRRT